MTDAKRTEPGTNERGMNERGMSVRREVLGDAHVDRAVAATTPFTARSRT
jgi:hypothetical protein